MIVNYTESGWQIITQRSHGMLAAQICIRWKNENQPKRWVETLIAAAEHDDVYNEFENDDLLSDKGGPVNFKMTGFRRDYCERLMGMSITKSRYIALLVSRHIQFVHKTEDSAKGYCEELRKKEKVWMHEINAQKSEVDASYKLLEFCDAFSLLICQDMIQPEQRKLEISNGPDDQPYILYAGGLQQIFVGPWPFQSDEFLVTYESRTLEQLVFKNDEEFRRALITAKVDTHEISILNPKISAK